MSITASTIEGADSGATASSFGSCIDLRDQHWQGDSEDGLFAEPYIDIDELREHPVPHRYVHGGFSGTQTRFSFYLPPVEQYEGRFFQHFTPFPQSENLAQQATGDEGKIDFSIDSGAYFVETNGGGLDVGDPTRGGDLTIGAYRANAAAARLSRQVSTVVYGPHRPYGYAYGGSGGGYRTIGAAENTAGVWDGFVPYVIGSPLAMPNVFSVRMHAMRILRDKLDAIADAYDAGGDPGNLDLTPSERSAFEEVTRMGFPPRSWFGWRTMGMHAFSVLYPGVKAADPRYFEQFWTDAGYEGADPDSSVHRDRVQVHSTVTALRRATPSPDAAATDGTGTDGQPGGGVDESFMQAAGRATITGIYLADAPTGWVLGAELRIISGPLAGTELRLAGLEGDLALLEPGQDRLAGQLRPGDQVVVDNSSFLAAQTYHRHQVPPSGYPAWDQFRGEDGAPALPQRPVLLGPLMTAHASGSVPTGGISEKMIVVACLLDREAYPWQADWYRQQVENHLDEHDLDDRFRLWFIDNALHGDSDPQEYPARTVNYVGALQAALRQLAAWVEHGQPPADSSAYEIRDGQVHIGPTAPERAGIQPVIELTANGAECVEVEVGRTVDVRASITAPLTQAVLVHLSWDLEGAGELTTHEDLDTTMPAMSCHEVAFDEPGTYVLAVKATIQTEGSAGQRHARVHNIARVRVVVR